MTQPPNFDELVDASPPDEERLRRAHDLLVAAGPPPELPPRLKLGPVLPTARRRGATTSRRPTLTYFATAAAIALVAFLGGRATGTSEEFHSPRVIALRATALAPLAHGRLEIGKREDGGWPMRLTAQQLPTLKAREVYAVFLTRNGKVVGLCGYFNVRDGTGEAYLNAPYGLTNADWIVTRWHPGARTVGPVVLSTRV